MAPSTPATMSKQRSTLLPQTATMSNYSIAKFRPFDKIEINWTCSVCFDIVERIVQLLAFDDVAWTLLLVWTGLKMWHMTPTPLRVSCQSARRLFMQLVGCEIELTQRAGRSLSFVHFRHSSSLLESRRTWPQRKRASQSRRQQAATDFTTENGAGVGRQGAVAVGLPLYAPSCPFFAATQSSRLQLPWLNRAIGETLRLPFRSPKKDDCHHVAEARGDERGLSPQGVF